MLIPFVEPPTAFWVGGDEYSGDRRPAMMAVLMLGVFATILIVEPFRNFFELELLQVSDYLFLLTVTLVWAIALRFFWRLTLLERFLGLKIDNFAPSLAIPEKTAK
jgi:cation-transporting P-type ATPase E